MKIKEGTKVKILYGCKYCLDCKFLFRTGIVYKIKKERKGWKSIKKYTVVFEKIDNRLVGCDGFTKKSFKILIEVSPQKGDIVLDLKNDKGKIKFINKEKYFITYDSNPHLDLYIEKGYIKQIIQKAGGFRWLHTLLEFLK